MTLGGTKKKGRPHRQTLVLGSKQVEPQTGNPSPVVLCEGDKHPWLLEEPLGQTGRVEKPRLHSVSPHSPV